MMLRSVHIITILFTILLLIFMFTAWNIAQLPSPPPPPVVHEPVTSSEMRYAGSWKAKRPVCSPHEFLLTFYNTTDKQIDLFYTRGQEVKDYFLASIASNSNTYQCCPHYAIGVHLQYRFHGETNVFKYPPEIENGCRDIELRSEQFL